MRTTSLFIAFISFIFSVNANDGVPLWMDYKKPANQALQQHYSEFSNIAFGEQSDQNGIIRQELSAAFGVLLPNGPLFKDQFDERTSGILLSRQAYLPDEKEFRSLKKINLGEEGYLIRTTGKDHKRLIIVARNDIGLLYGTYHLLRLMQTGTWLKDIDLVQQPKIKHRLLNHWDNLDRSVERGYAGISIWDWHTLPDFIDQRYIEYARANASIGINGTVLTNVNANALALTPAYLKKAAALAETFRPYGIKVYLTARFSAPMELGGLSSADPLDPEVVQWWKEKVREIYQHIPDFGGFLVKANSEGQPGPQQYGRSHAEGANLLADALKPFGGIIMWRAFVYDDETPDDRVKQAYQEFMPLDGKFRENVILQIKNGPLDFQPREPFHPLFGALKKTAGMMEFQLTQEYLGFATHLVYLPTLFQEVLQSDTHIRKTGATVSQIISGETHSSGLTGIAGVANIGNTPNWTGHPFAQANWYGFGRLAWNPDEDAGQIAAEWLRMSVSSDPEVLSDLKAMMLGSRETTVNYMTPLGLHHIMGWDHHFGPAPWIQDKARRDWTSVYYHQADEKGIGFDRTRAGSDALSQYHSLVQARFENPSSCPPEYLLWFHHLSWDFRLANGRTLWDQLCRQYDQGVEEVASMQSTWKKHQKRLNPQLFEQVSQLLSIQHKEAKWWRDACLSYFQSRSGRSFPAGLIPPEQPLSYYMNLNFHYVPGI